MGRGRHPWTRNEGLQTLSSMYFSEVTVSLRAVHDASVTVPGYSAPLTPPPPLKSLNRLPSHSAPGQVPVSLTVSVVPCDSAVLLLGVYPRELKQGLEGYLSTRAHSSTVHSSQESSPMSITGGTGSQTPQEMGLRSQESEHWREDVGRAGGWAGRREDRGQGWGRGP